MFLISVPVKENHSPEESRQKLKSVADMFATFSEICVPNFQKGTEREMEEVLEKTKKLEDEAQCSLPYVMSNFEEFPGQEDFELPEYLISRKESEGHKITDFSWNLDFFSPYFNPYEMCSEIRRQFDCCNVRAVHNTEKYWEKRKCAAERGKKKGDSSVMSEKIIIEPECYKLANMLATDPNNWEKIYKSLHDPELFEGHFRAASLPNPLLHDKKALEKQKKICELFQSIIDKKNSCGFEDNGNNAERKFIPRELSPFLDDDETDQQHQEGQESTEAQKKMDTTMVGWVKDMAYVIFYLLVHIKVYRAFLESLVKYKSKKFQLFLFHPKPGTIRELREELDKLYDEQAVMRNAFYSAGSRVYDESPYLFYKIDINFPYH